MLVNVVHHSPCLGDTIALAHTLYAYAYQHKVLVNIVPHATSKAPLFMNFFEGMADASQTGFHPDAWWRYGTLIEGVPTYHVFDTHYPEGIIEGPRKVLGVSLRMNAPIRRMPRINELMSRYAVVSPYASGRAKEIPYADWQPIIDSLVSKGYQVVTVGPRIEEDKRWTNTVYLNTWGHPLVLLSVIQHASLHVGLSSGNSWLADACDVPTIRLNSFSDGQNEFVPSYQVENTHGCRNCYDEGLMKDYHVCPRNKNRECANNLGYQVVQLIRSKI